jgi:phage tail sheath protein FI
MDSQFAVYEYYAGVFQTAYLVSVDPESKDRYGKTAFANRVISETSENIVVFVGGSKAAATSVAPQSFPRTNLAGATALSATAAVLEDELYEQLNLNFYSKEDVQIIALVDLDFPLSIKQRMDQICNVRKDCVALLNVPSDRMINIETGQKTNNQTGLVKAWAETTMNIDSSYSALYANYFKVYDPYNDTERWIPCTGYVAERLAFTFNNFEPWNAVAGLERGVVSGVLKVAYNPNPDQQKVLYPARINPIVAFRGEGIVIWGQKTLESEPIATDRLNVRELLIYIAREVEAFSRTTLFKQNDAFTRASWRANVGPFLNGILQRRGIEEYVISCDEKNNPETVVARNEFQAFIIVRPTTVAEFVKITIADVGGSLTLDEALLGLGGS